MSALDPTHQNKSLDAKITAGFSKLAEVQRVLVWAQAQAHGLSPIQLQILLFISYHAQTLHTVSVLAQEFNLSKATISDAVKALTQKKFIAKQADVGDARSYMLSLTLSGKKIVTATAGYLQPLETLLSAHADKEKEIIWKTISRLIQQLAEMGIITHQRMCYACSHYEKKSAGGYCNLIQIPLKTIDVRLDCPEFEKKAS